MSARPVAGSSYSCTHRADIVSALEIYRRSTSYDGDPKTTQACAEATQAVLETIDEQQGGEEVCTDAASRLKTFFATIQQKLNGTIGEYGSTSCSAEKCSLIAVFLGSSVYSTDFNIAPATDNLDFDWSSWLIGLEV
jgi:hypothetical protein